MCAGVSVRRWGDRRGGVGWFWAMAMSESRKRKLEMLTRSIAKRDFASASELLRSHGHSGVNRSEAAGRPETPQEPAALEEVCKGAEDVIEMASGPAAYYLIRRTLEDVAPESAGIAKEYSAVLRGARQRFDEDEALTASPALCCAAEGGPEDLLFMDTETCGLSGTAIFLVGMMAYVDGQLIFRQCFARDYSEEPAILRAFADRYAAAPVLVTFNGKAFDMSMIRERSAFHGIDLPRREAPHLDLLHESRRRWRKDLPNCKLQTLERYLCGRRRVGDIPGAQIPDAYHRYVASGDARQVGDILHHNLLDLLTMAQLVVAILTGCGPVVD